MTNTFKALALAGLGCLAAGAALADTGDTLKAVKARGALNCTGGDGSNPGFAEVDDKGNWKGLDIELCRAMSTAIFGTSDKLKIIPISWAQRWPSLQSGDVDVVIKSSGGTFSRDTELGFQFSNSYYLGTTTVLAHKSLGISSLKDADGGTVCVLAGSSQEKQVSSYAEQLGIKLETVAMGTFEELNDAYYSGRCDMTVGWGPTVGITRSTAPNPEDHIILPDQLSLEPEVMIVRQGDDNWLDIANWMLSALLFAEQEGVTSANVDEMKAHPPTVEVGKLLGATPGFGKPLGLSDDWAYNVIKQEGNYAEIFERTLGQGSTYGMPRGLNALWNAGGVLFPYVID